MTKLIDDLKDWLQVQSHVPSGDLRMLQPCLDAAQRAVDDYCGRKFGTVVTGDAAATIRHFDGPGCELLIDDVVGDIVSVQESSDRSTWTTRSGDVRWLEPANDTVRYRLVSTTMFARWVKVEAKFGVDQEMADAARLPTVMKAGKLWKRRDTINGVEGFDGFGVVRINRAEDPDICSMLDPLARVDRTAGIA